MKMIIKFLMLSFLFIYSIEIAPQNNLDALIPINNTKQVKTRNINNKKIKIEEKNFEPVVIDAYDIDIPAPSGITFDGEYFWISNYAAFRGNKKIYKLDSNSWKIIDSISTYYYWTSDIVWDGSGLWTRDVNHTYYPNLALIKYSREGVIVKNIPAVYSCYWGGIAWDGVHIYYGINICNVPQSKNINMIYKVAPENGTILDSIYPPSGNINSLFFDKGNFWYGDNQTLKIYNTTTNGKILTSFNAPSEQVSGITVAKGYLWCLDFYKRLIYQIDIGLAPSIPQNLVGIVKDSCVALSWVGEQDKGIVRYKVYRSSSEDFSEAEHIATVNESETKYMDCNPLRGNLSYWITAVDSNGIESHPSSEILVQVLPILPLTYELSQNYPNPFNYSTIINFKLSKYSMVTLKIYDITGREIETLISEYLSAGEYSKNWQANSMPSGIYFYRLQAGFFNDTKKLVLLK